MEYCLLLKKTHTYIHIHTHKYTHTLHTLTHAYTKTKLHAHNIQGLKATVIHSDTETGVPEKKKNFPST